MLIYSLRQLAARLVALLVLTSLASADVRRAQAPTAVEQVKRQFAPSPGVNQCYLTCLPGEYVVEGLGTYRLGSPLTGEKQLGNDSVFCRYYNIENPNQGIVCSYSPFDGARNDGRTGGLCGDRAVASPGCPTLVTPVERLIRSRQYNPKRRAPKQRSSASTFRGRR